MKTTPFIDAGSAAIGAVVANFVVFPFDVIKTKLQTVEIATNKTKKTPSGIIQVFLEILKRDGLMGLYTGLASSTFATICNTFSYFYIHSTIRNIYVKRNGVKIGISTELILGALSGALTQFIALPLGRITTVQQTSSLASDQKSFSIVKNIIKGEGLSALWKGFGASLVLCSNPAITFGVFERLKTLWVKRNPGMQLTSIAVFRIAVIAKSLATVITYPFILAKVRLQAKTKKVSQGLSKPLSSASDVLAAVYKKNGFSGFYDGLLAQILKAVSAQAIVFMTKEKISAAIITQFHSMSMKTNPNHVKI